MHADLWILVVKLVAAMGFGGGLVAAFVADDQARRQRAVHWIASPCLVSTWGLGFALLAVRRLPLTELWVVGALLLSVGAHLAAVSAVSRESRSKLDAAVSLAPVVGTLALMVFKPLWAQVLP